MAVGRQDGLRLGQKARDLVIELLSQRHCLFRCSRIEQVVGEAPIAFRAGTKDCNILVYDILHWITELQSKCQTDTADAVTSSIMQSACRFPFPLTVAFQHGGSGSGVTYWGQRKPLAGAGTHSCTQQANRC